jgi:hypothetical protein
MPFNSGQKVTLTEPPALWCWMNGRAEPPAAGIRVAAYGEVYTVIKYWIMDDAHDPQGPCECLWLAELAEVPPGYLTPYPYEASAFRPVVEPKTDISVFTKILDQCKVD